MNTSPKGAFDKRPEDAAELDRHLFSSNRSRFRTLAGLTVGINLFTFLILFPLSPRMDSAAGLPGVGLRILMVRIVLLAASLVYLYLSRSSAGEGTGRTQKFLAYVFLFILLSSLAYHSGLFQAIRPLVAPYIIGVFAVASFTFLPGRAAVIIFGSAWIVAFIAQFRYQPDHVLLTSNLIHLSVMTLIALFVSRITHNFKVNEIRAQRVIERLSLTDQLTGLANRRHMEKVLLEEWNRCRRQGKALGLLMADIDHFKSLNDRCGHPAGDECLSTVGTLVSGLARRSGDLAARYGGEEFLLILPDTDLSGACRIGETLRSATEGLGISNPGGLNGFVTMSLGAASTVPTENGRVEDLLKAADEALYRAKSTGRNRVVPAEH